MFRTALSRFHLISLTEGLSFLALLLIAMPLKYVYDLPLAVTIVGSIHGGLFLGYLAAVAQVSWADRWSFIQIIVALIASVIPFGWIFLNRIRWV
ncbi:integral membrane protein [Seinonella peptonophila]|uniref:Integral membrane protein n=1 Tax=Seinonella peptonophila TaxID=112248 RepID=A0A1M4X3C5_9BACL|nr:DUF3817 domain-containing protein [Seinonella peptonophila]SHE87966.1 integral membrane protein [Seinonella peptonophila]